MTLMEEVVGVITNGIFSASNLNVVALSDSHPLLRVSVRLRLKSKLTQVISLNLCIKFNITGAKKI